MLKSGRVMVNGKKEKSAKLQIDEERDEIRFDGQVLEYEEFVYYMMNKPKGVISATEDPKHRTVLDCWMILLGARKFPSRTLGSLTRMVFCS